MNILLGQALHRVFADLVATGVPVPRAEPSDWQTWEPSESAYLWSEDGTGRGVWVDPSLAEPERVAMVAEQVQELVVEDMPRLHLPTNWPPCPEHPRTHPLEARATAAAAVWACPQNGQPAFEIGRVRAGDVAP